jgi:hypothetical protein
MSDTLGTAELDALIDENTTEFKVLLAQQLAELERSRVSNAEFDEMTEQNAQNHAIIGVCATIEHAPGPEPWTPLQRGLWPQIKPYDAVCRRPDPARSSRTHRR